ncbi:hypothetical protein SCHIN_v1c05770 [Spiroplasma chinense]|uniref:Uncharacterized protein n=1 Tax=Spiroplasma chinense TaxID=216932 RepID=A0A5B9Y3X7_9MOLU|nr:hypothetical protein [Spiroplasma chinense]QEH61774.1 hypothetical protein SCHIN_v1c05770 [Spiroplasma chinense]
MYIPTFILIVSVSTKAVDKKQLIQNLVLGGLQNYIYILLLITILFLIAIIFSGRETLINLIYAFIVFYYLFLFSLQLFKMISASESKVISFVLNYLGPQMLLTNVFQYNLDKETVEIIIPTGEKDTYYSFTPLFVEKINYIKYTILFMLMVMLTGGINYLNCNLFKNKSFVL